MADIQHEIQELLDTWQGYWARKDFAGIRGLWDADDPQLLYVAEEAAEPMFSLDEMQRYWALTDRVIDRISVVPRNLRARQVADDIALAFFELHWDAAIGASAPIGGDVRVLAAFRRKPEGWRFFHYLEGPLAMLTQVRQFASRNVTPAFLQSG
jgi:hypothetical protein